MAINEVVRFECDDEGCEDVPPMKFGDAVIHAEMHKAQQQIARYLSAHVNGD